MNNSNKCPQCKTFIIGTYCYKCKKNIRDMQVPNFFEGTPLEDIFNSFNKKQNKN